MPAHQKIARVAATFITLDDSSILKRWQVTFGVLIHLRKNALDATPVLSDLALLMAEVIEAELKDSGEEMNTRRRREELAEVYRMRFAAAIQALTRCRFIVRECKFRDVSGEFRTGIAFSRAAFICS